MPDAAIHLVPTDRLAPEALHAAFLRAFADYVAGPFDLALDLWPGFLARQGIDLTLGRAAVSAGGDIQAFALVAPRAHGMRWRLGTMGAVPEARGSGAAPALLHELRTRALASNVSTLELEVFAQNDRALRLYERHGFVPLHPLHGYRRAARPGPAVDMPIHWRQPNADALAWLRESEVLVPDLPLQVSAAVVDVLTVPWSAWRRGGAQLVASGDASTGVVVRSLIDRAPAQADAVALVEALLAAHPDATFAVPALQRIDLGGEALTRLGFEREPMWQWLMRCDLADRPLP